MKSFGTEDVKRISVGKSEKVKEHFGNDVCVLMGRRGGGVILLRQAPNPFLNFDAPETSYAEVVMRDTFRFLQ
jgi:hypothetical protein